MSLRKLPFRRRVLGIETQVSVVLATKKISLSDVLNLSTGSMLAFDKGCDEPLILQVGKESIAAGEAVKVGDKFGLRVRELLSDNADDRDL